jgi:autotransporter-associated beta strand protein
MKRLLFVAGLLPALILMLSIQPSVADSATWNLNPVDISWNNASNWTPVTVPNGDSDVATFGASNITGIALLTSNITVADIVFSPGASAYTINTGVRALVINQAINNNSGITQTFDIPSLYGGCLPGSVSFVNSATAGSATTFILEGGLGCQSNPLGSHVLFFDSSSADHAMFVCEGGTRPRRATSGGGGTVFFFDTSSAGSATFITNPARGDFTDGGKISFQGGSANNGTFINYGGYNGKSGGSTIFAQASDAGNATVIAKTGFNGGGGGSISFTLFSTGGTARVEVFGNGNLDLLYHRGGLTIGSIEGNGDVFLGNHRLRVGTNNLDTNFSGVISDGDCRVACGQGGSLTKLGAGELILSNANTYSGGTIVDNGKLAVSNTSGSATGTGAVQVNAGMLSGKGIIAGPVTVGKGTGRGAVLSPGNRLDSSATLTIQNTLTLNADATYRFSLRTHAGTADDVTALGVTINSGAQFSFNDLSNTALTPGTVFTVINNTAATPIAGTFSNLPDGATFSSNGNTYQVSYEGGDGNDLTLTVVP